MSLIDYILNSRKVKDSIHQNGLKMHRLDGPTTSVLEIMTDNVVVTTILSSDNYDVSTMVLGTDITEKQRDLLKNIAADYLANSGIQTSILEIHSDNPAIEDSLLRAVHFGQTETEYFTEFVANSKVFALFLKSNNLILEVIGGRDNIPEDEVFNGCLIRIKKGKEILLTISEYFKGGYSVAIVKPYKDILPHSLKKSLAVMKKQFEAHNGIGAGYHSRVLFDLEVW